MTKEKIKATVYNHKTIIEKASPGALDLIQKHCTLTDGYRDSSGAFQIKQRIRCFDKYDESLPTGYLSILADKLDGEGIDIEAYDERTPVSRTARLNNKKTEQIKRRFNQSEIYKAISEGEHLGFITSPTGSGKTNSIIDAIDLTKVKTLILTPTTGVRNMLAKELGVAFGKSRIGTKIPNLGGSVRDLKNSKGYRRREYNIEGESIVGPKNPEEEYLQDKGFDIYGSRAFRTRASNKEKKRPKGELKEEELKLPDVLVICIGAVNFLPTEVLEYYEMLIVDEGHFGKCETIRDLSLLMPNCYYKYAFSATNGHENPVQMKLLCSVFGNRIIYETDALTCTEEGIIQKVEFKQVETRCNFWLKDGKGKYVKYIDDIIKLGIVGNADRNDIIVSDEQYGLENLYHIEKARVIAEVGEEYHGHILKKKMEERGVKCYFLYSDLPRKEKDEIYDILENSKEPYIVFATTTARQGVNTVTVSHIWLVDARKSIIDLLQWIGRAQRIDNLTDRAVVINPTDHFHPKLFEWSRKREKDFNEYYVKGMRFTESMFEKHGLNYDKR